VSFKIIFKDELSMYTVLVKWFDHWQELIGAFIGGLMGFVGAFIVAYAQRRREENAAAMLLISDLTAFVVSIQEVNRAANNSPGEVRTLFIVRRLIRLRSHLSPLFETARSQVMPIDKKFLAIHLSSFQIVYAGYIQALERLSISFNNNQPLNEDSNFDTNVVITGIATLQPHAEGALYYLDDLFFQRFIFFRRIILPLRRFCCPTAEEIRSKNLINNPANN
jgi:hypothetical protein